MVGTTSETNANKMSMVCAKAEVSRQLYGAGLLDLGIIDATLYRQFMEL